MTLYHGEPNGPSLTVLAALEETQIKANLVPIDLTLAERHLAVLGERLMLMSIYYR